MTEPGGHFDGSTFSIQPVKRSTPVLINGKKRRKHVLKHQDVVVQAATGSGKTLAFLVPLLSRLEPRTPA